MRSSIIIANYNKAQFLEGLLTSIFDQIENQDIEHQGFENKDFEIQDEVIIVDDASTDESVEIIKRFPCELITNAENIGPAASRNKALKRASGEILIFCDSDTLWEPHTIGRIKKWFEDPEIMGVTGNLSLRPIRRNWPSYFYLLEEEENLVRSKTQTGPCGYWSSTLGALRAQVLKEDGGFDEKYKGADIEDLVLGAKLAKDYKLIFDKDLIFHHDYPNLSLMFTKAVKRVAQITVARESFSENPLIDNNFRKIGYLLSSAITLGLFIPETLPFLILLKACYHHYFFKKAFQLKGILFCVYSLFLMYIFSFGVFLGLTLGHSEKLKNMLKGS